MQNKVKHTISIMGRTYNLLSDKSEEDIRVIEELINNQMQSIKKNNNSLSTDMTYALTLLYFAEDLNKNKNFVKKQEKELIFLKFDNENLKSSTRNANEKLSELKDNFDKVNKFLDSEKEKNENLEIELISLQKDFENLKNEKFDLNVENENLRSAINKLNKQNKEINDKIDYVIKELEKIKKGN